jgi:hypothetical protein
MIVLLYKLRMRSVNAKIGLFANKSGTIRKKIILGLTVLFQVRISANSR